MKKKLDKYIKDNLNIPQQPPQDAWEFIQSRIPNTQEKKRVFPFWARLSGIAAVLFLMVGFGYWLGTYNASSPEFKQGIAVVPVQNSSESESLNINNSTHENSEEMVPNYIQSEESILNSNHSNSPQIHSLINDGNKIYSYHNYLDSNKGKINSTQEKYGSNFNTLSLNSAPTFTEIFSEKLADLNNTWKNLDLDLKPILSLVLPNSNDSDLKKDENPALLLVVEEKSNQEKKKKKKADFDRFHISAFASPLAFNSFVGSSMLADEMSQYNTENNVTLAYGIKAAYSLSPKLKIRTGVSMVGMEQITKNVPLEVQVSGPTTLASIDKVNNINYEGSLRIDTQNAASLLAQDEISGKMGYGNMQQQTSYVEIPLEAEYSLFQTNSIGISATGGGSTWVLSKNKIYVHTDDYTQELGEANNLNNVTFSANAGLKFDLNLTDNVKLNVEPNFRYLVNPVNNIEKYNPYTVGVNAGISVSLK